MFTPTVIIFGPTGSVGSATALTALKGGAKVILAMRDTHKSIPGLTPEQEASGNVERIYADLSKPDTIHDAVNKTKAKHAFIYLAFGTADFMRASIEALKDAGIQTVVFLSSMAVHGDIRAIVPNDFIAFTHAQVEVNLQEVFGVDGYVAIRPGFYASNSMMWKSMIPEGDIKLGYPDARFDYIAPEDIGCVSGTFLVKGLPMSESGSRKNFVNLVGPEMMAMREAVNVIGKAVGKEVKVSKVDEQVALHILTTLNGLPEPVAKAMLVQFREQEESAGFFNTPGYEEARGGVERYTGKPSLRFHEWVGLNKEKFLS